MGFLFFCIGVINIFAFLLYATDKHKSKKHVWRISERALLFVAFIGGSFGSLLAMRLCHHKTKHKKFTITVPLLCIFHLLLLIFFLKPLNISF